MIDALTDEIARLAFYQSREVKRLERGVPIFKHPTFEGWLREKETKKEIERLIKLYEAN